MPVIPAKLYILKVALYRSRGTWRRIAIRGDQTLGDLHQAIFDAFDRYDEHLYSFYIGPGSLKINPRNPRTAARQGTEYSHPELECDEANAEETPIASLRLGIGRQFLYLFDFGDEWWHIITVEQTNAEPVTSMSYPTVIAERGEAPPQYPEYNEEEE